MKEKNKLTVRLSRTGTLGFEFNCAQFRTFKYSDGHISMYCKFDWEKKIGEYIYDTEYGSPEAIKMFLFSVEMNNNQIKDFNFSKPFIKAGQYSSNGVYINEIENLNIEVNS